MSQQPTRPHSIPQRTVAVVGGGITGLVAARALARVGLAVTVLEAGERVGGQVRTVEAAGHPGEHAARRLVSRLSSAAEVL